MSFLDDVKRQEKQKNRESEWFRAVEYLCRFTRQYLRKAEARSQLIIKPDLIRVNKILLDRLTIFLNGETVTIAPLSLSDSRAPSGGGCVVMSSTNGVIFHAWWNRNATAAANDWVIFPVEDPRNSTKGDSNQFSAVFADSTPAEETLSEDSLDQALLKLFGVTARSESPVSEIAQPRRLHKPLARTTTAIPANLVGYYRAVNNGKGSA